MNIALAYEWPSEVVKLIWARCRVLREVDGRDKADIFSDPCLHIIMKIVLTLFKEGVFKVQMMSGGVALLLKSYEILKGKDALAGDLFSRGMDNQRGRMVRIG